MYKKKIPSVINIYPTMRCPLNCGYCYVNNVNRDSTELSLECYKNIIGQAVDLGIQTIDIAGGEPLMYEYIIELLEECQNVGLSSKLVTNGLYLDRYIPILLANPTLISELHISLDSYDAKQHDEIRKHSGLHEKVVGSIRMLTEQGFHNINVNYVLQKESYHQLEHMLTFTHDLQVHGIDIQYVVNVSEKTKKLDYKLSLMDIMDTLRKVIHWYDKVGDDEFIITVALPNYMFPLLNQDKELLHSMDKIRLIYSNGVVGNNSFKEAVIVNNNGDVTGSTSFINASEWIIGNITETPLKELWENPREAALVKIKERSDRMVKGVCSGCKAARFCRGGDPVEFSNIKDYCVIKAELNIIS